MSTNPKPLGRPLGKTNLSDDVKIGILQQKKLQIVSQGMIAKDYGVARKTVNVLSEDDLSENGKAKLNTFVENLAEARDLTIQRIKEKLINNEFKGGVLPNLLNAVNNNHRLETNQPTTISGENISPIAIALSHAIEQKRLHCTANNQPFPTDDELLQIINSAAKANNVDANLLRESVLKPQQNID